MEEEIKKTEYKDIYELEQECIRLTTDLKKRGMSFVGSTIIYSYLQAIGIIYSHENNCYLYKKGD